MEKEERCKNLVLYGVSEEAIEQFNTRIGDILENTGQKPRILECYRLSKVQVTYDLWKSSWKTRWSSGRCWGLQNCWRMQKVVGPFSYEQRRTQKELISQLRQKRTESPDARYRIRSGQVMLCTGPWALDGLYDIIFVYYYITNIHFYFHI